MQLDHLEIRAVSLRLELRGVPRATFDFRAGETRLTPRELDRMTRQGERQSFRCGAAALDVVCEDWCRGTPDDTVGTLSLSALVVPFDFPLLEWLDSCPTDAQQGVLVYQRRDQQCEPSGWQLVNRTTGHRLAAQTPETEDQVDRLFPLHSAVLRPSGWTNREFLDGLVGLLHESIRSVYGWCAVADEERPLRLLTDEWPSPVELDAGWSRIPKVDPCDPVRTYRRPFHATDPGKLLAAVARTGQTATATEFLKPGDDHGQFPASPGPVLLDGRKVFARAVVYEYAGEDDLVTVRIELVQRIEVPPPPRQIYVGPARFAQWAADRPDLIEIQPDESCWAVMDPSREEVLPNGRLTAEYMVPKANMRAGTEGAEPASIIYVRHEAEERFKVLLITGATPVVPGMKQSFCEYLEAADLTLCAGEFAVVRSTDTKEDLLTSAELFLGPDANVLRRGDNELVQNDQGQVLLSKKLVVREEVDVKPSQ